MKFSPGALSVCLLLFVASELHHVKALKCGGLLVSKCLGATDIRYDKDYSNDLGDQSDLWRNGMLTGLTIGKITSFAYSEDLTATKAYAVPYNVSLGRFGMPGEVINLVDVYYFWNASIVGSRYYRTGVVITPPVCGGAVGPPPGVVPGDGGGPPVDILLGSTNTSSTENDTRCAISGKAIPYNLWGTSTYEKDGTLRLFKGSGYHASTKETFMRPQGDSAIYMVSRDIVSGEGPATTQSSGDHIAYDGKKKKVSSISVYNFADGSNNPLNIHSISQSEAVNQTDFLWRLSEAYDEYNIPMQERIFFEKESGDCVIQGDQCVTEDDFCNIGKDPNCSTSPYQEPAANLNAGGIALIAVCCAVFVAGIAFLVFRKIAKEQKSRYKIHVIRGIARNITIASSAGMIDAEQLMKEFKFMDKDKGGGISKEELKEFLDSGKVGSISDKDFEALWCAIDLDGSGEVDFVEFITFLDGCGSEFDQVHKETASMTREERLMRSSRRLSAISVSAMQSAACDEEESP